MGVSGEYTSAPCFGVRNTGACGWPGRVGRPRLILPPEEPGYPPNEGVRMGFLWVSLFSVCCVLVYLLAAQSRLRRSERDAALVVFLSDFDGGSPGRVVL